MKWIENASLRLRLIVVIFCTALLIWLISTAVAWIQVRKEINEVFDAQQILFAQRLASSNLNTLLMDRRVMERRENEHRFKNPRNHYPLQGVKFDGDALAFAVFTTQGEKVMSDGNHGDYFNYFSYKQKKNFTIERLQMDDDWEEWRIFWLPVANDRLVIAVGQEVDFRDDLVEEMVFSQMWIWFASLPVLLAFIVWIITYELRSLKQVSRQLQQRTPEDNQLLSTDVPKEILPLVQNLNRFFERTTTMLLRERRFTSDAAHELRSPLAALKIQTEIAQLAEADTELRHKALQNLNQGINRATQLVDQLLTLSRLDNLTELEGIEEIEWQKLLPSVIGERYFHAQRNNIELEFYRQGSPITQKGQPLLLSLMIRNLIENAIKYCPAGSTVQVLLKADRIIVEDNGGGVDEQDLPKLGQRFYRPAGQNEKGSGLGLSIVHRIAELHHLSLKLENYQHPSGDKGLRITIFLMPFAT